MCRKIFLLLIILFLPTSVSASEEREPAILFGSNIDWLQMGNGTEIKVHIDDQVTDGCWTNFEQTKVSAELELQRSGYVLVGEDETSPNDVVLRGIGYQHSDNGLCVVRYDVEIWTNDVQYYYESELNAHELVNLTSTIFWTTGGVLSAGKQNVDVQSAFIKSLQRFLVTVPKKQRSILQEISESDIISEKAKRFWAGHFESR